MRTHANGAARRRRPRPPCVLCCDHDFPRVRVLLRAPARHDKMRQREKGSAGLCAPPCGWEPASHQRACPCCCGLRRRHVTTTQKGEESRRQGRQGGGGGACMRGIACAAAPAPSWWVATPPQAGWGWWRAQRPTSGARSKRSSHAHAHDGWAANCRRRLRRRQPARAGHGQPPPGLLGEPVAPTTRRPNGAARPLPHAPLQATQVLHAAAAKTALCSASSPPRRRLRRRHPPRPSITHQSVHHNPGPRGRITAGRPTPWRRRESASAARAAANTP